ncbi:MAG TPA: hypothetical protein VGL22_17320 [Terracidiphilus sp.]
MAVSFAPTPQAAVSHSNASAAASMLKEIGITALNHTVFEDYHLFRVEMRILPGVGEMAPAQPKQP